MWRHKVPTLHNPRSSLSIQRRLPAAPKRKFLAARELILFPKTLIALGRSDSQSAYRQKALGIELATLGWTDGKHVELWLIEEGEQLKGTTKFPVDR
jgi:hypothetical protein